MPRRQKRVFRVIQNTAFKTTRALLGIERVLLAGQPSSEAGALEGVFRARGITVSRARTARDALVAADTFEPDVMVIHWSALDVVGPKFIGMMGDLNLAYLPFLIANAAPFDLPSGDRDEALIAGADMVMAGAPKGVELDAILSVAQRRRLRDRAMGDSMKRVITRLEDLQKRFDSLDSDLSEAKKLQQGLMRDRHLHFGSGDVSLILRSSGHVGGDLVGHFPINDDAVGFFALDVSGHGVSSALMTARLAGYLSATNPRQNIAIETLDGAFVPRSPAAAVADLNTLVMEDLDTDHYFTMILGYFEPEIGKVTFAQAGHPHPLRQEADGTQEYVTVGGLPVGLIPGADYEDTVVTLAPGDRLLLLSDGFTEATISDGSFLGEDGLSRLLEASRHQVGPALLETLVWDLSAALGEAAFQDDLSGVLLERLSNPKT